ncbi:MAG: aldehyde dehydrogenase family protein, partial [Chitinophagales bacterium]
MNSNTILEKTDLGFIKSLGINQINHGAGTGRTWLENDHKKIESFSPVDGKEIAAVYLATADNYEQIVHTAEAAFKSWRMVPAPQRGQVVRQIGEALRKYKEPLGKLVSWEMGKSLQEGLGEVQEMIDICDFAVGLSRQLHGLTMHSERPQHRMYEQYHPLGIVGIISAFNFPVAVWSWNAMIAWVCGDVCIWKPSEKAPLCAIACQNIVAEVFTQNDVPEGVSNLIIGEQEAGKWLSNDERIPLVSATGSIGMGKKVGTAVAKRLGRSLLELGGNNAVIITPDADLKTVIPAVVFGAVGTCGQRCTSTRRLIVHESIFDLLKEKISNAYEQIKIGNPLDEKNHVGPLIDKDAVKNYLNALAAIKEQGGELLVEGGVLEGEGYESECYVKPALAAVKNEMPIVQEETFAPILYLIPYKTLSEAIELQNGVKQGLSSAIMTGKLKDAEQFLSHAGSDCGIANVNIGTSGAEIGGAFGGEKETGGGRESGSDAWKVYMRRQTNTINYGDD